MVKHRPTPITIIAIYHLIKASAMLVFILISGSVAFIVPKLFGWINIAFVNAPDLTLVADLVFKIGSAVSIMFVLLVAFYCAAAYGVINLKKWARLATLISSFFEMAVFPAGTIAGILIIWYLLKDEAKSSFKD